MTAQLTDQEKAAVFRAMVNGWEAKDWRACADLFAPNGMLQSMMKDPIVGRESFYERMVQLATPDKSVKLHIRRMGVVEGALVVERTDEVIIDGQSRSVPVVGILEFEGPLIASWRDYYDRGQLMWAQRKTDQPVAAPFVPPSVAVEASNG